MGRRLAAWMLAVLLVPSLARAGTAHVQYVSASHAYLDAGRDAGLAVGAEVKISRDGHDVATLVVSFVAAHSAACAMPDGTPLLRAGDLATFASAPAPADSVQAPAPAPPPAARTTWTQPARWRGSVSAGAWRAADSTGSSGATSLSADIRRITAGGDELALRVRGWRSSLTRDAAQLLGASGSTAAQTRVLTASLRYRRAGGAAALETGRLLPSRLEALGTLDGAQAQLRIARGVTLLAAGGRSADTRTVGAGRGGGTSYGAGLDLGSVGERRWHITLTGGSRADSVSVRRRFAVASADQAASARLHLYERAEVDLAADWQRALGRPRTSLTAWSVSGDYTVSPRLGLGWSADARTPLLTPELAAALTAPPLLDRTTGARLSCRLGLARDLALRLAGDWRRRDADGADTRSLDALAQVASHRGLTASAHALTYDGPAAHGTLADIALAARASRAARLDLSAGVSRTRSPFATAGTLSGQWLRLGADLQAPGGLWGDAAYRLRSGGEGHEFTVDAGVSF